MSRAPIKTSVTHPLRIDKVNLLRGQIGITFCPGKHQENAKSGRWKRDLAIDLQAIKDWGALAILCLIEKQEMMELGVELLPKLVPEFGMEFFHLPIPDVHAPTPEFDENWHHVKDKLYWVLENGGRILVHCKGGLGRAGTIAAKMLIENGTSAKDAIDQVRRAHSLNAIETLEQEQYLMELGERRVRSERIGPSH